MATFVYEKLDGGKGEVNDSSFLNSPLALPWIQCARTTTRLTWQAGNHAHLPAEVMYGGQCGPWMPLKPSQWLVMESEEIRNYHRLVREQALFPIPMKKSSILNFLQKCFQVLKFYELLWWHKYQSQKYTRYVISNNLSFSFIYINGYNPKAQSYTAIKYKNYRSELAAIFMGHTQGCGRAAYLN